MRALIIEDQSTTGEYLRQGLSESSFVADLAQNGPDGLHLALTGSYDVIILDVMLPGMDGWQVLKEMRQAGKQTPVIMLTANDQPETSVSAAK